MMSKFRAISCAATLMAALAAGCTGSGGGAAPKVVKGDAASGDLDATSNMGGQGSVGGGGEGGGGADPAGGNTDPAGGSTNPVGVPNP